MIDPVAAAGAAAAAAAAGGEDGEGEAKSESGESGAEEELKVSQDALLEIFGGEEDTDKLGEADRNHRAFVMNVLWPAAKAMEKKLAEDAAGEGGGNGGGIAVQCCVM